MARTVEQGFAKLLENITPTAAERTKASSHRASIESKLDDTFGIYRMFETGSFKHGTGVSVYSDVDFFVSLKTARPQLGSSILTSVRSALLQRFPQTYIHVSRPAVVLDFGQGYERVEVIPAYFQEKLTDGARFKIPGVATEWMDSSPEVHVKYVNDCNTKAGVKGGAKGLARLAKAWKYYRDVPISSFYLEMRAAAHMNTQSSIIYPLDFAYFLNSLERCGLADMNDPTGATGRIKACSSTANEQDALSKLRTATRRAEQALAYNKADNVDKAFEYWNLLFNGRFPGR
ncbi:SMODS domain-containing nucleotidyltransferase [Nocardia sp. NPDC004085]